VYYSLVISLVISCSVTPLSRPRVLALRIAFARDLMTRLNSRGMTSAIARDLRRCIFTSLALLLLLSYKRPLCMGLSV